MRKAESTPAKVVVTADDFGLSKKVNEGILVAFRQGVVRNTAILVNFPDVEESVAWLQDAEGLDVGIHLNLTSGPPVLKAQQVSSLVGSGEMFPGLMPFFTKVALGRINWLEVRHEWEAQIELGLKLGCNFSSITSHQHVHMFPKLTRITAELAKIYDIPAVRLSRFHFSNMFSPLQFKTWALFPWTSAARSIFRRRGIFHNDYVLEIPPLTAKAALARVCHAIHRLPDGVHELVCHPGYVDAMLERRDHYTVERLIELEVLTAPRIHALFQKDGLELITYRHLAATGRTVEPQDR